MEKEFIQFEEAVALKKLEFNNPCFGYYENQDKNLVINYNNTPLTEEQQQRPGLYKIDYRNSVLPQWATAAPTYSQAFNFFRENYGFHSWIDIGSQEYSFVIYNVNTGKRLTNVRKEFNGTFEEAELECLKKLIKFVPKK